MITHQEFRSAFVSQQQRQDFLLDCARQCLLAIRKAWPTQAVRVFVFGSAINTPLRIGAGSDLDIAVSGLDHIADKPWRRSTLIMNAIRKGLANSNQTLPIDILTFDAQNPATWFAKEIIKNGQEISVDQ